MQVVDPAEIDLKTYDWSQTDIAFIALHGAAGEDGRVQALLDQLGVPYTGSDPIASQLGMSKSASKERFAQWNVPTPNYVLFHHSDPETRIAKLADEIRYPLVVKPNSQGSSLGVTIVRHPSGLHAALQSCFEWEPFGILESFVPGTEWTVGLLDDQHLPPILIETNLEFFDYRAKYEDEATQYKLVTGFAPEVVRTIEEVAERAAKSLGTRGLARVDLRLDEANRPWVLEVNTVPGMTSHSLIPKAAAQLGWSMGELCERAIYAALAGAKRVPWRQSA
ncbi:MAG: D-alanine--D-alanine ligase [Planctomycetales bacterium]